MALYGGSRDISLFRNLNRELLGNIITQQCVYYKLKLNETKVNMYGEAAGARYYYEPVILNALIERNNQEYPEDDLVGVDFQWGITYKFLRDDLVDAQVVPEVGDIIMYYEGYYEVHATNANQYFVGKDPRYPYNENPLNPGLEGFGASLSIICETHYTPADKVQITKERL
tara:strand:+ start:3611 stop:4123 length:513 start_codon:yes stop_codon:yes gene_type:complete